ncbi:uncharacterized protein [Haliotis asinina]|uniref:uncharacterized protein n=1 Tax=Haliotis asinina TaxID=109174 RepID=UPI003531DB7E
MRRESLEEAVELRTSSIRDRGDCGSSRESETYCHAVQLNPIGHPLPDVVSQNNGGDEKVEDPYDTIGSVGTLSRIKDISSAVPNSTSYCGEGYKGYTASTESESEMVSSQSLSPYARWSQISPTTQTAPAGITPGWCSKKRVMIIGTVVLILVLVSALTVTGTLLITGKSGQTGDIPPASPTKETSVSTSTSTSPSTSTSTSTSTTRSSISTAATPALNSTSSTYITSSTPTLSTLSSTSTTSIPPATSTSSISPSTSTTTVAASSTTPTTTTTPSPSTPSTSPSTSTTTPTPTTSCNSSRKCHSCTSRNVRCPVNGTMAGTDSGQVMPCPCGTACFSAVRYTDGNVVHRGCTEQYPAWDTASSTDLSCREIGGQDFLCFCLGDRCNVHNMTPYINYPSNKCNDDLCYRGCCTAIVPTFVLIYNLGNGYLGLPGLVVSVMADTSRISNRPPLGTARATSGHYGRSMYQPGSRETVPGDPIISSNLRNSALTDASGFTDQFTDITDSSFVHSGEPETPRPHHIPSQGRCSLKIVLVVIVLVMLCMILILSVTICVRINYKEALAVTAPPSSPLRDKITTPSATMTSSMTKPTTSTHNAVTPNRVSTRPLPTSITTASPTASTAPSPTTTTTASPTTTTIASSTTSTTASPTTMTTASQTTSASPITETTTSPTPTTTAAVSTTSTTTDTHNKSCTASRKCHMCTSRNARCPANGNIAGTHSYEVMSCPCGTACYSDIRYDDESVVYRGCTRDFPQWDQASSKDPKCQNIGQHFLCFCQGDRCNTHDMTSYLSGKTEFKKSTTFPSTIASTTADTHNTSCTVSRKCHMCTSRNARCPANGNIAGTHPYEVMSCPCGTACYSDIRYEDESVVYRGCTRDFPQWDQASSKDLKCQNIGQHFLCFCQGDRCNTHDMTSYLSGK